MQHIRTIFSLTILVFGMTACHTPPQATQTEVKPHITRPQELKIVYYVDMKGDGNYTNVQLAVEPEPKQGKDGWARDFYGSIKYPPAARENGVTGVVVLEVKVNESGRVEKVSVKQGISSDCDAEAKRAFLASTQQGYVPFLMNSVPVKFKMELPIGFWLE